MISILYTYIRPALSFQVPNNIRRSVIFRIASGRRRKNNMWMWRRKSEEEDEKKGVDCSFSVQLPALRLNVCVLFSPRPASTPLMARARN